MHVKELWEALAAAGAGEQKLAITLETLKPKATVADALTALVECGYLATAQKAHGILEKAGHKVRMPTAKAEDETETVTKLKDELAAVKGKLDAANSRILQLERTVAEASKEPPPKK